MSGDKDDQQQFLARWSARKRQREEPDLDTHESETETRHSPDLTGMDAAQTQATVQAIEAVPAGQPEPLLTDKDMPALETLSANSDISGFLSKGVSSALRRAALRHVFQQPEYNVRDGLNDYDGDYTVFEPLGDTVTADMKFHAARKERERLEAERLEAERIEAEKLEERTLETQTEESASELPESEPLPEAQDTEHDESEPESPRMEANDEGLVQADAEDEVTDASELRES